MHAFSVRINDELHNIAKNKANEVDISLTELVRQSVHSFCTQAKKEEKRDTELVDSLRSQVDAIREQLHSKEKQLDTKDEQISQLHQLVAMSQSHANELTQQLDRAHLQLEDMRHKRPWWRRWGKGRKEFD